MAGRRKRTRGKSRHVTCTFLSRDLTELYETFFEIDAYVHVTNAQ